MPRTRVVLAILDAFPDRHVGPELTPTLWGLAAEGGRARNGGRAVLPASTYPNHATFVTGVDPSIHRIMSGKAWLERGLCPAQEVGPATPTLFDHCRSGGLRAVGLFGDQNLVGVCGARAADRHWPPDGVLPEDAPRAGRGYGADAGVVAAVDALEVERADLVVVQLDEVDTARHLEGPDTEAAVQQMRATDAAFGQILERLRPHWNETVVIALSDHDQEPTRPDVIDLPAELERRDIDALVEVDGTAAWVVGNVERSRLLEIPGIADAAELLPRHTLVWGEEGQLFGIDGGLKGHHGSPRTACQMAIVGGGHGRVGELARRVGPAPHASGWAGVVLELLDLPDLSLRPPDRG